MREKRGLTPDQVLESRRLHGSNLITPPPQKAWWWLYLEKFKDPIIMILLVATLVTLIIGVIHQDFTESVGIIIAILIATGVGFWQEYDAKRKFDAMRSDRDYEIVTVRRAGEVIQITKDQLVVGDRVLLTAGDEIPADIELLEGVDMRVSEAAMTGESMAVAKYPTDDEYKGSGFAPNMLLRGTTIEQGLGEGVVVAVGDKTQIGVTTRQASEETENKTPLEVQLDGLAARISTASFVVAITMFVILNIVHWSIYPFTWSVDTLITELKFLMGAVVVIIVAVPEGLPLSVTLALAFSMKTMAREHNLVKKMHACETIGAVNLIFTDKTGTLTQNVMSVVEVDLSDAGQGVIDVVGALNSIANWSHGESVVGNPTDSAILRCVGYERSNALREEYRVVDMIPFSSKYKYMACYVEHLESGERTIFIKGAPEVIARLGCDGSYLSRVAEQQERGRRAITAAVIRGGEFEELQSRLDCGAVDMEYLGTWYIEDPIRADVPAAIEKCYSAGIDVVMMTGDNFKTAAEIARQAGFNDIWAVEASAFFEVVESEKHEREFPNVIARCTPNDKLEILKWAQSREYVCAMTGDGVNDSPSLNYADVGIAMGSGTSVAKEAADIVLLNDAFPSIVTGVKWGRSLFKNIKNFLFFQLSINVSACLTAMFGPLVGVEMPFTVIQFLWINLVMDSLAAIALASEPADERVLLDRPRDKSAFIIDRSLAAAIFGFGGFVWLLCMVTLWGMESGVELFADFTLTHFFAAYMVLNWWNMFNARVVGKGRSVIDGLSRSGRFLGMSTTIIVMTILLVQFGGELFSTDPLSLDSWIWIIVATSPVVILRELWHRTMNND